MSEVLVHVTRGGVVESRHWASLAVCDAEGKLVASAGSPDRITFWRSAAKPIQALPLVMGGGVKRFALSDSQLAVIAGSHCGEDAHIEAVQSILARIGLDEDELRCGAHMPYCESAAQALVKAGELPRAIHSNCSGKHAGMLALACLKEWPTRNYLEFDHPVQQTIMQALETVSGVSAAVMPLALDGCGAPTTALTLQAMATAYARLAMPSTLPSGYREAAQKVSAAMRQHPHMTAGTGRFCTALMAATGGRVLAKAGAEGVVNLGLPGPGLGVAVKVEDGSSRAVAPLALEVLCRLGILTTEEAESLADLHRPVIRNCAGMPVGHIEAFIPESLAGVLGQLRR